MQIGIEGSTFLSVFFYAHSGVGPSFHSPFKISITLFIHIHKEGGPGHS